MSSTIFDAVDEAARRRFENAWKDGSPLPIEDCLPAADHPHFSATLEELVIIDMEMAGKSDRGKPPRVEDYLARFPSLDRAAVVLRLIKEEFRIRAQLGETPSATEFQARFPSLAAEGSPEYTLPLATGKATPSLEIPGYAILGVLGRGGMGVVYKARHEALGRLVAIKTIQGPAGDEELLDRFRTEAEAVARLQHPHIVQIFEIGTAGNCPYLALEFVAGGSLHDHLAGKPQAPRTSARLVGILARALHYAHGHGIIHRDIKPANVLLGIDGSMAQAARTPPPGAVDRDAPTVVDADAPPRVLDSPNSNSAPGLDLDAVHPKITDFGLAKRLEVDSGRTRTGAILGTPSYMAPEQAAGDRAAVGPAADVYALGAILYEMLSGRPPFRGPSVLETLQMVQQEEAIPLTRLQPRTPRDLETICAHCLEKVPAKRYADAAALADDLDRFLAGEPIRARPIRPWQRLAKWARRQPVVAALAALVLIVTLLGIAGILWQWGQAEAQRRLAEDRAEREILARQAKEEALQEAQRLLYIHRVGLADRDWRNDDVLSAGAFLAAAPEPLRRWEWRLADWRCHAHLVELPGQSYSVDFQPGGRLIATARGNQVYLWNEDGKLLRTLAWPDPHNQRTFRAVFSPDGTLLAAGGTSTLVPVWRVADGMLVHRLTGHSGRVHRLAFDPTGRRLACGTGTRNTGEIVVWKMSEGTRERTLAGAHVRSVDFLSWSPDGKRLASAAWDHNVWFWDVDTGKKLHSVEEHVHDIGFTPDGRFLATLSEDRNIRLWDARDGKFARRLTGPKNDLHGLAFDGGDRLAAAGLDTTIRVWNWRTGELLHSLRGHPYRIHQLAFSPGGDRLASASATTRVWNLADDHEVRLLTRQTEQFTLHPGGRLLAEAAAGNHSVTLWNVSTGRAVRSFAGGRRPTHLAFSPDLLAVAREDGTIATFGVPDGGPRKTLLHPHVHRLAFDGTGNRLASAARKKDAVEVRLWEPRSGSLLGSWQTNLETATGLAFADKLLLVSGKAGSAFRLATIDLDKQSLLSEEDVGNRPLLAVSPDGTALALAGHSTDVAVKEVGGKTIRTMKTATRCLAFDDAGERLVTADRKVRLWNPRAGIEVLNLEIPRSRIADAFLVDPEKSLWGIFCTHAALAGDTLAVRTCDGSLWYWRPESTPPFPVRRTILDFEHLPIGPFPSDAFKEHGVRIESRTPLVIGELIPETTTAPLGTTRIFYTASEELREHRLFRFDRPLCGFALAVVGVRTGASIARWRMEALDAAGNILATTGELDYVKDDLPRVYHLRADGIHAVRILTDNRNGGRNTPFATHSSIPTAYVVLERPFHEAEGPVKK